MRVLIANLANGNWRNGYRTMLKLPVPVGAAVGGGATATATGFAAGQHAQEHADATGVVHVE